MAAEHVPVQMEDRLARSCADVDDHPVVLEPRLAGGVGDELEHPLRLFRLELADLPEARNVALRNHEQVDVGAGVDVFDRDEALRFANMVALPEQPAEE